MMSASRSVLAAAVLAASGAHAQSLRGSTASMERQHGVALENDFTFLQTGRDVARFARLGLLVPVSADGDVELAGVSHPYARPAVRLFIQRLGTQYRAACDEPLVVTSLTRPENGQPRNASDESVHPTGMAVDLRVSRWARCRTWLERVLLALERTGVLEATRERRPPHYHVAIFPGRYAAYVRGIAKRAAPAGVATAESGSPAGAP